MPLLSLAQELKKRSAARVVYIGLRGEKVDGLEGHYGLFDEVFSVPSGKFRRYHGESLLAHLLDVKTLALNARDTLRVARGVVVSWRLLKQLKPAVVFSKGGFVVVPVGIAAHQQRIPIVTHDSDTLPGLANRIIGRWAAAHATGMPAEFYNYPKDKTYYTGIPVSDKFNRPTTAQVAEFKKQLDLPSRSSVLLVVGGGLGSVTLNKMVISVAGRLLNGLPDLHLLHLCGKGNQTDTEIGYKKVLSPDQKSRVRVVDFTDELYKYCAAADLVVTRCGATTLAELATQSRAVVSVPSPFLSGGHQLKNAEMLKKQHAAEIAHEDIAPDDFYQLLSSLLHDAKARQKLATALHSLAKPNAAGDIAQLLLKFTAKT